MTEEPARDARTRASVGLVAAFPLFVLYELCLVAGPEAGARNAAERLLGRALEPLGDLADPLRWLLLLAVVAAALVRVRRMQLHPGGELLRQALEGLAAAIALGPLLLVLLRWADVPAEALGMPARLAAPESFVDVLRRSTGAVWEELVFRLLAYGLLYLLVRRLVAFFGGAELLTNALAELTAILGSALLFAAFHLEVVGRAVAAGAEPYDASLFLWRALAGVVLALLCRLRGLGVAAWAHALFNFGLALGVAPP